jgi:hypothetical protein
MASQTPSVGRIVHFVYGDLHFAAIITAAHGRTVEHEADGTERLAEGQALTVFPPGAPPFFTVAPHDEDRAPATWHWPEYVP